MIDEIGATSMMINGSEESGIDVLEQRLKTLHQQVLLRVVKVFNLDESDYLNPQSTHCTSWFYGRVS